MIISKEEIALYLSAYTNTLTFAVMYPEKKFAEIFFELYNKGLIPLEPNIENYNRMISVHCIFCNIKLLEYLKDGFYTGLEEKNIKDLHIEENEINKICLENYTKKDIILYVRNALAHNDKENPLYWFEQNNDDDMNIHILLKNTKATFGKNKGKNIPFELVITPKTLNEITQTLAFASKRNHMLGLNVKNNVVNILKNKNGDLHSILRNMINEIYYYRNFYKTLSEEEKNKLGKISEQNYIVEYENLLKSKLIETKKKQLSPVQKNTLYTNILKWKKMAKRLNINEILDYESSKIIPVGLAKVEGMYLSSLRALSFMLGISYIDSEKMLLEALCEDKENLFSKCKYLFKVDVDVFKDRVKFGILDSDNELDLNFSIFNSYLFDTLITDEEVCISNKTYSRERIRNSFIHGRWYVSEGKWELFDGLKNEFDFDWHKSIDMIKLKEFSEDVLNSRLNKTNKK